MVYSGVCRWMFWNWSYFSWHMCQVSMFYLMSSEWFPNMQLSSWEVISCWLFCSCDLVVCRMLSFVVLPFFFFLNRRANCSDCITEKGECAWCENTRTCLPFSDYVTRYIYGQCTAWVDSVGLDHGCHSCTRNTTCDTCLAEFGCGWCGNDHNPTLGLCMDGDFNGMLCYCFSWVHYKAPFTSFLICLVLH